MTANVISHLLFPSGKYAGLYIVTLPLQVLIDPTRSRTDRNEPPHPGMKPQCSSGSQG